MNTLIPQYLVVDGLLHGTGIRDQYKSGYMDPKELDIEGIEIAKALKSQLSGIHISYYSSANLLRYTI